MNHSIVRQILVGMIGWLALGACCHADEPVFQLREISEAELPVSEVPERARELLSALIREAIPVDYENRKKWGQTKKIWNGVDMRLDGLELRTKRRWKEKNHGTWKRYRVEMIDPERNLKVELSNFSKQDDGTTEFDLGIASRLRCSGQLQQWNRGLRILSISAEGRADVRMAIRCAVATSFDLTKVPPDVLFHPRVLAADIRLRDFTLDRISHADGPLVEELGDAIEDILQDELADRRKQLVEKMNRQITKQQDKLRLSLHDRFADFWLEKR